MSQAKNYFTFKILDSWLAIEPDLVNTIIEQQRYIPLPLAPHHVLGIIPHGQTILPIFHLALFLKMLNSEREDQTQNRLLILKCGELEVAIPIHSTGGVETVYDKDKVETVLTRNGRLQDFLIGEYEGNNGITGILDINLILERSRV